MRGETEGPVDPWIFLFQFLEIGVIFPVTWTFIRLPRLFSYDGQWLTKLNLPVSSGPLDTSHWIPQSYSCSGLLYSLKPNLLLQWAVLCIPTCGCYKLDSVARELAGEYWAQWCFLLQKNPPKQLPVPHIGKLPFRNVTVLPSLWFWWLSLDFKCGWQRKYW